MQGPKPVVALIYPYLTAKGKAEASRYFRAYYPEHVIKAGIPVSYNGFSQIIKFVKTAYPYISLLNNNQDYFMDCIIRYRAQFTPLELQTLKRNPTYAATLKLLDM